jgi:23S rRNA pseudouridine2605 synthase
MKNRLSKVLAAAGIASRRACEKLICARKVRVNRDVITLPQYLVDPAVDQIVVEGKQLQPIEKKVYFLLNKPQGYLCTNMEKPGGAKRVLDLFAHLPVRLFTAGRLDQDTTGLIVVTNDGAFANRLVHPSFENSKEYLAKVDQEITWEHLQALSAGVLIEKTFIKPLNVKKIRRGTVKIVVAEGKKHEVRSLLACAGLTIRSLARLRIGPLVLGNLLPGQYRELTTQEIGLIYEAMQPKTQVNMR